MMHRIDHEARNHHDFTWITGANIVVDGGQRYPSARRFD
jgi:hypothetical protein